MLSKLLDVTLTSTVSAGYYCSHFPAEGTVSGKRSVLTKAVHASVKPFRAGIPTHVCLMPLSEINLLSLEK